MPSDGGRDLLLAQGVGWQVRTQQRYHHREEEEEQEHRRWEVEGHRHVVEQSVLHCQGQRYQATYNTR